MGNQESQPKQEDFFLLDHITKMTLSNKKKIAYYLIHPHKQTIDNMVKQLRKYFKIDHFLQIKTLKQEMNFINKNQLVKVIVSATISTQDIQYIQNQKNIYQIIIFGQNVNNLFQSKKIVQIVENYGDLLNVLNELQKKDSLNMPSNNILLVDQDTKLVNKYRLNYHCNTKFMDRQQAKQDFITLARYLFPQQQSAIDQFTNKYDLDLQGRQRHKMVLQWTFKNSFYWHMVAEITRNTTDPKKLSYVRLALKDLFEAIQSQYYKSTNKYQELYIVVELTEEEKTKLQKSKGRYLIFTSFVKGYLIQKQANLLLKQRPNAFKFIVRENRKKLDHQVDFGFTLNKDAPSPNVIFNIYNVFTVEAIEMNAREGEIVYGALPMNIARRKQNKEDKEDKDRHLSKIQRDLIRNFDYLEDIMLKIDSQATLLQLSGYYKESLQIYDKKVDFIRRTNQSQQSINRCMIHKADALRISGQFQYAQKQYQSAQFKSEKMKLISLIHLAQLYMQQQDHAKFQKIIDQITPQIQSLRNHQKQQYFKARNLIIIRTMRKGSFKKAEQMLNDLKVEVTTSYPLNLEGKPLVHDIYRSIATCKSKLGKHSQALDILKSTLQWQLVCQGKTANVALTETLIQSVSRTSGNTKQLQLSLGRLDAMSNEVESYQNRFKSTVGADLNKSLVSISIS